jgi:hypothetical protein
MIRRWTVALLIGAGAALTACQTHEPAGPAAAGQYDRPGFAVKVVDGRLWVFRGEEVPDELPGKHSTFVGAGPDGMTIKAPDAETVSAYIEAGP